MKKMLRTLCLRPLGKKRVDHRRSIGTIGTRVLLCAALAAGSLAGCSARPAPTEQLEQDGANSAPGAGAETARHQKRILGGESTFTDCSANEQQNLLDGQRLGRIVSRSSAFLECLALATHDGGVVRYLNGGTTFGPYKYCDGEPFAGMTDEQRVAHLLSISASPLSVNHICGLTIEGGSAHGAYAPEGIGWQHVPPDPAQVAVLIWHEVTHNYGYMHRACWTNDHEAPNLLGRCMQEVIDEAAASPQCGALACGANELAIPVRYGRFGTNNPCECVPEVHEWPYDENETGDRFGASLAVGDFNGDGRDDLAVGAPGESISRGAVYTFRGSPYGVRFWRRTTQPDLMVSDFDTTPPQWHSVGEWMFDQFGLALAAGDLNHDGFDDLVVGTPGKNNNVGVVYVLPGSTGGLDTGSVQQIDQSMNGGALEKGDRFGDSIAIGYFGDDEYADLAVGAPTEHYGAGRAGVVAVCRGLGGVVGAAALVTDDGGFLHQAMGGYANEEGDQFGYALAAGDIDGDSRDELVIGGPGENEDTGWVFIADRIEGSWDVVGGISYGGSVRFGEVLAVGDLMSNTPDDIVVGAPREANSAGSIYLFRGRQTGMPLFAQKITANEPGDELGAALAVGHLHGTAGGGLKMDLLVGQPGEAFGSGPKEGRVLVYAGTVGTTLTYLGYRYQADFYDAGDEILPPEDRSEDRFGAAVAIGHFSVGWGATLRDFVVGAPLDRIDGVSSGAVFQYTSHAYGWQDSRKVDQLSMRHGDAWPVR